MVEPITLSRLAICFVPVFAFLVWLGYDRRPLRPTLLGLARMTIQLLAVGYVLVFLFETTRPWLTLSVLTVMGVVASTIAIRTSQSFEWERLATVGFCLLVTTLATLGIVLVFVLDVWPWQEPRTVIPLAGMTLSSAMNAISLAIERFDAAISDSGDAQVAANKALDTALIPMTNSLMAVGVVSIPGMMTGQVLAGVPPLIAARYQIMIMCLLFASAGLATKLFLTIQQRRATT